MSVSKLVLLGSFALLVAQSASLARADDFVPPPPAEREAVAALAAKGIRVRVDGEYRVVAILLDNGNNDDLKHLAACEKLFGLDLYSPDITDAGLEHLIALPNLTAVNILTPGITDEGVAKWREARPTLRIDDRRPGIVGPGSAFSTRGRSSSNNLVSASAVQDDLKLTPEQRQVIQEASDIAAFLRARDEKVNAVLTAEQKSRLKQIELQNTGIVAIERDEIARELNLSPEQLAAVRKTIGEALGRVIPSRGRPGAETPASQGESADVAKQRDEKLLKLLNDDQRKSWLAMQGPKGPKVATRGFSSFPSGSPLAPDAVARNVFDRNDIDSDGNLSAVEFARFPESVRQRMKDAGVMLEFPVAREAFEKTYAKYLEDSRIRRP
jgi:hypothetical protein